MDIGTSPGDATILREIGQRLAQRRIELELTQAGLAEEAGVAKRTVERIEAGESTQTATLIRILRRLGLLDNLDALLPLVEPRPLDLLKMQGKQRRRASAKKCRQQPGPAWSWGDQE